MAKIFILAASLRRESSNVKLGSLAEKLLKKEGINVNFPTFREFDMPLYDGDLNSKVGMVEGGQKFITTLNQHDGLIIVSPEYNFSTPGPLKNLIDWVSRADPMPWAGQSILLMSASPSLVGGNRGLWHTRVPLETCGAFVYPDMFSLASAYTAFNKDGDLKDSSLQERLQKLLQQFVETSLRLKKK